MDSNRRTILTTGAVAATTAVPQVFAQQGGQRGGADLEKHVNVRVFGAVGNNVADDTAAIQSAIDYAATHGISGIYMPAGNYKITSSLYLDPPNNLRARPVNTAKTAAFSLTLFGDENIGNHEGFGTRINTTFNKAPAIYIGGGQGMFVKNLTIFGLVAGYRANIPVGSVGIGICDGGGGASRTRIENVMVENFRIGFQTGLFGGALCDSNTFIKCTVRNALIGFWFAETQNFINSIYDAECSATTGVLCSNGGGCHVFGGNWSLSSGQSGSLAINTVSGLTPDSGTYTFTANVPSPNSDFRTNYNAYTFETTHFGIIPATLDSFVAGVAKFRIPVIWKGNNYGNFDLIANTDIQTELQAATKVFCAEMATCFQGINISVIGIHVENPGAPTTLVKGEATFGANYGISLSKIYFNSPPSMTDDLPLTTDVRKALYYAAHTFPFIWAAGADIYLSDSFLLVQGRRYNSGVDS